MNAPAENMAYVAMVNGKNHGRPDAMGVVDWDLASSAYGHSASKCRVSGQKMSGCMSGFGRYPTWTDLAESIA